MLQTTGLAVQQCGPGADCGVLAVSAPLLSAACLHLVPGRPGCTGPDTTAHLLPQPRTLLALPLSSLSVSCIQWRVLQDTP